MSPPERHTTVGVRVGDVQVGGGAPVVVQSMTNTDTVDAAATAKQIIQLAEAGSELVRVTVNTHEAAQAVPEIRRQKPRSASLKPISAVEARPHICTGSDFLSELKLHCSNQ